MPTKQVIHIPVNGQIPTNGPFAPQPDSKLPKLSVVWTDTGGNHFVATCHPTEQEFRLLSTQDFADRFILPIIAAFQRK